MVRFFAWVTCDLLARRSAQRNYELSDTDEVRKRVLSFVKDFSLGVVPNCSTFSLQARRL